MQLKTIRNRVQRFKSFVYGAVRWVQTEDVPALEVEVHSRRNRRAVCSGCGWCGPGHDRLPTRRFEFVPLWGMKVFLVYAPRRVGCSRCGVKVERLPWAMGTYALFTFRPEKRHRTRIDQRLLRIPQRNEALRSSARPMHAEPDPIGPSTFLQPFLQSQSLRQSAVGVAGDDVVMTHLAAGAG